MGALATRAPICGEGWDSRLKDGLESLLRTVILC